MRPAPFTRILLSALLAASASYAQVQPAAPTIEPVGPTNDGLNDGPPPAPDSPDAVPAPPSAEPPAAAAAGANAAATAAPAAAPAAQPLEASEEGYLIKDANLNDIFQFLAKQAGRQYFHNSKIASPEYRVTGHLNDGNPLQQMEELAFMYSLTLYTKGSTVYALTQAQLSQLPSIEFQYHLRYIRPDLAQLKDLIQPVLSPSGIVNYEPKTNTVIIIDNAQKVEAARTFLHDVDQVKGQIVVETKILRINSTAAERVGVDWSSTLGESGLALEGVRSLNSVFGLNSLWDTKLTTGTSSGSALTSSEIPAATNNVVLAPVQLNAVLRALAQGGLATQVSNPTLITEDNEQATIAIIDRVPIITSTVNQSTGVTNITEEVRYKIDDGDSTIDKDPSKHREIGISLVVKPTLLPDGTVRMEMRPRSAQITEQVRGQSGNLYPRVTESMVESLARVPNGYSLVVGGFYGEVQKKDRNKVPLLGDIPVFNFFFKSKESTKEQTSLVFVVTPTAYDPRSKIQTNQRNTAIRNKVQLTQDYDWVDDHNPGPAHEPNLGRGVRGLEPYQAPYYPTEKELNRQEERAVTPAATTTKPQFSRGARR